MSKSIKTSPDLLRWRAQVKNMASISPFSQKNGYLPAACQFSLLTTFGHATLQNPEPWHRLRNFLVDK
jgi:hypothetical protein